MSRTGSIITEPVRGVCPTPSLPNDFLEQIRAKHIDFKRRQGHVIDVLSHKTQSNSTDLGAVHESDSILVQIWHESTTWHYIYRELCQISQTCSSDLERLDRLQLQINALTTPTMVHRPCSCMGKTPSSSCPWAFIKSLYSRLYAAFLIDCLRQQDRDLIGGALALFLINLRLAVRAHRLCSADIPADESESPAIASLLALTTTGTLTDFVQTILSREFISGRLPDEIAELVFEIVVERGQYHQISLLLFCISMASSDSPRINRLLSQLINRLGSGTGDMQLAYWTVWSNWQVYIGRASIAAALSLGDVSNPYEIAQETSTVTDETPNDSIRRRIFLLLSFSLVLYYRICIGAAGREPNGATFINQIVSQIRILKSSYKWDTLSYWVVHAMLYQLVHRLNSDLLLLRDCFSNRFALLTNMLALCTVVEDFVYFSPTSYEEEIQAEIASYHAYIKLRREIRLEQEFRTGELETEIADSVTMDNHMKQISQSSITRESSPDKPTIATLESVFSDLEGFDYKNVQRKLGLHLDASTGIASDLNLCQIMLQLLTRVRDEILPRLISTPGSQHVFIACNQLREEVRFFEHTCHFLDHVFVRNEKTTLSSILAKRLFDTGRIFKGFNIQDKKQWDQYVQGQIQGQLLKEQRRAANNKKPSALATFQVMANLKLGRNEWAELHLESENFPSHTHTIGDYRPEVHLGTNSDQARNPILNRRTQTSRSVLSVAEKPTAEDDQVPNLNRKERLHPQPDCVCRMLILYKGREVVEMQNMSQIKALYLVSGSHLLSIQSNDSNNVSPTNTIAQEQLWNARRYHQKTYPYLCVVEFRDGFCSEYLFKTGAERLSFAIMCGDFRNDIIVYQPIDIPKAPLRAQEPIQCEICSRSFSMFAKKSMCRLCHIAICKVCSEKISAPEFDLSYSKPIRLCRNCLRTRSQLNHRIWPKRLWFERAVAAAFTSKLSIRPIESATKHHDRATANNNPSRIRSIASVPAEFRRCNSGTKLNRGSKSANEQSVAQITLRRETSLRSDEETKGHSRSSSRLSGYQASQNQCLDISAPSLNDQDAPSSGPYKPLRFKTRRVVDKNSSGRMAQSATLPFTISSLNNDGIKDNNLV